MSSMIGCRESDAGHYKEICEKRLHSNYVCCEDGISQPIKCRIFSIHPIAFPLLMWHFQLTRHIFHHGKQKSPRQQALHLTCWVLCIDRTMHRNVSVDIFFLESLVCNFFDEIYHMGAHFQLSLQYGDLKWLKREVVLPGSNTRERELNHMLWLVSWFITQMPIGCSTNNNTETKMHTHSQSLAHLISTCMHKIENNQFCFSGEEHSDMIMSVAV